MILIELLFLGGSLMGIFQKIPYFRTGRTVGMNAFSFLREGDEKYACFEGDTTCNSKFGESYLEIIVRIQFSNSFPYT